MKTPVVQKLWLHARCLLAGLALMAPRMINAQVTHTVTPADYPKWSTVFMEQASAGGGWASFSVNYETGEDTLEVRQTSGTKKYAFAGAQSGVFSGERWFICKAGKGLIIQDLKKESSEYIANAGTFLLERNGSLLLYTKSGGKHAELIIKELGGGVIFTAQEYLFTVPSPFQDTIAIVTEAALGHQLSIYDFTTRKHSLLDIGNGIEIRKISWQKNGSSLAIIAREMGQDDAKDKVGYFSTLTSPVLWLTRQDFPEVPTGYRIITDGPESLAVSRDGKRVFFTLGRETVPEQDTEVQVWNTADKMLYPNKALSDGGRNFNRLVMWRPENGSCWLVNDFNFPQFSLNGSKTHAVCFNRSAAVSDSYINPAIDYYITDLDKSEKKLLLQSPAGAATGIQASPGGKYLTYFKQGHYWSYEITTGVHHDLTAGIPVAFTQREYDHPGPVPPYPVAGWDKDDSAVFLYDAYDIWMVAPDGSWNKKITGGRSSGTRFRFAPQGSVQKPSMNYEGNTTPGMFDASLVQLISKSGSGGNGYSLWSRKQEIVDIVNTRNRCSQAIFIPGAIAVLYMEEHYNSPPAFYFQGIGKKKKKVLQSNPQHYSYAWGTSETFTYRTENHGELRAALFYPAGYDAKRQYPMIVHVYEKESQSYDMYVNPSEFNSSGLNISNLTSQGYFVLAPDVSYTIGSPGKSALECVKAATVAALKRVTVDPNRIGIIGGSMGGYETSFIITQTDMFAAAVAGAGITDLVSNYFYVSWNFGRPNFWRFENGQMRMGKAPFEDYEAYTENSPIHRAENITTPLLSWSGIDDYQVHYYQSMELHLALRRLKKDSTLLLYPGEGHFLAKRSHQQHCTRATEQWFAHYLKGEDKPEWAK